MPGPTDTSRFPFRHTVVVTLRDLDGLGHVNHAVFLTYLEVARTRYYAECRGLSRLEDLDFILGSLECRYHSPAFLFERLVIALGPTKIGRKSWDLRYEVREEASGRLVLRAHTTQVQFDYAAGRSVDMPPELRAILERERIAEPT